MLTHLLRILKYGTSYAIATGFFPKAIAQDVLLLYSFMRIPDNIVDSPIEKGGQRGDPASPLARGIEGDQFSVDKSL